MRCHTTGETWRYLPEIALAKAQRVGRRWWGLLALLAIALGLGAAGCGSRRPAAGRGSASGRLAEKPRITSTSSSLSPDGTVAALAMSTSKKDQFLFYDVRRAAVVAKTPDGWAPYDLVWGPGHSYLQLLYPPVGLPGLYWVHKPGDEPKLLTEGDAELSHWGDFAVDPAAKTAVFTFYHKVSEDDIRAVVVKAPIQGGKPHALLQGGRDMQLAGVVADPNEPGGALAVLAQMAPEGERLELRAFSCATGKDRWQVSTPRRAGKWMLAKSFVPYREHQAVLAEQLQSETEEEVTLDSPTPKHIVDTRLWLIDTRTGVLTLIAEIPDAAVHLLAIPSAGGKPTLVTTSIADVWQIAPKGATYRVTRIIEGRDAHPIGATADPQHGIEVYFVTRYALWRCRLEDSSVTRVWGEASSDPADLLPRVLHQK
jgi:hypothetical protein